MRVKKIPITMAVIFAAVLAPVSLAFAVVESVTRVGVGDGPLGVAVSPDGARVYVVNSRADPPSVSVIESSSQSVVETISLTGRTSAYGIAVSPDGSFIVVSSPEDDSITKIQTTTHAQTAFALGVCTPLQLALSADGQYAFVTCNGSNSVAKIELVPSGYVGYVPTGNSPVGIARKPGTNQYYVVNQDGDSVTVIDGTSMTSTGIIPVSAPEPHGIAFTPDGSKAFVTGRDFGLRPGQVSVISSASNTEIAVFPAGDYPQGVAVSTDGSKLFVANSGSDSDTVDVFSTDTYVRLETVVSDLSPTEIAVSPTTESIWVTKINDDSVDNIFFRWPQPQPQPDPAARQLAATGFSYVVPVTMVATLLFSGLIALSVRNRQFRNRPISTAKCEPSTVVLE